jgi:thiamine-monophosphate kinase
MSATPHDEFNLIAELTANLPVHPDVTVGIGDDAAIVRWPADRELVVTCDAQVEGRHFLPDSATPEELGARAMLVNISDIAAMGAEPRFALTSLIMPRQTTADWLARYYAGLRSAASACGVAIIGGNIAGTVGPFTADITLIGQIEPGRAIRRSGARAGDGIFVTGHLGGAAAGLLAATHPDAVARVVAAALARVRDAWLHPIPRVRVGRALAEAGLATAMIDISDGLAADLGHILMQSHVGALLEAEALPIDAATVEVARALGRDPVDLALYGGDDYELLFTVPVHYADSTVTVLEATGANVTRIGWIQPQRDGLRLRAQSGATRVIEPRGWDHLRSWAEVDQPARTVADTLSEQGQTRQRDEQQGLNDG